MRNWRILSYLEPFTTVSARDFINRLILVRRHYLASQLSVDFIVLRVANSSYVAFLVVVIFG